MFPIGHTWYPLRYEVLFYLAHSHTETAQNNVVNSAQAVGEVVHGTLSDWAGARAGAEAARRQGRDIGTFGPALAKVDGLQDPCRTSVDDS